MSNIIADIRVYQSFDTVEAFNLAIRAFLYRFKSQLSNSTLTVLTTLKRHAAKVPGVAFAEIKYFAAKANVSISSVNRALKTLEEDYGLIERKNRRKKDGRQACSYIVFQPQDVSILPSVTHGDDILDEIPPKADEPNTGAASSDVKSAEALDFKPCSLREKDTRNTNVSASARIESSEFDELNYVPDYVPRPFVRIVGAIFPSAHRVIDLWHKVRNAVAKTKQPIDETLALKAFIEADYRRRRGGIHSDFDNYYFGTLVRMVCGDLAEEAGQGNVQTRRDATPTPEPRVAPQGVEPAEPIIESGHDAGGLNVGGDVYAQMMRTFKDDAMEAVNPSNVDVKYAAMIAHYGVWTNKNDLSGERS